MLDGNKTVNEIFEELEMPFEEYIEKKKKELEALEKKSNSN